MGQHHGPVGQIGRRTRLLVLGLLLPLLGLTVVLLVVLRPSGDLEVDALQSAKAKGVVTAVVPCPLAPDECDRATVKLTGGDGAGTVVTARAVRHPLVPRVETGQRILLGVVEAADPADRYLYVDQDRSRPLLWLAGLFAAAVIALSRWRGLAALGALAVTAVVLTQFVLPAILSGSDPLLVAVVGGTAIMVLALYLTHGISVHTSVALLGTMGALMLTAVLGEVFLRLTRISGLSADGASEVASYVPGVDVKGLLIAGLVIGALGVLDDVAITQTAVVWELSAAKPTATRRELFGAGLRVGRAHVAAVVNTLVLAYAGAALPMLMLFSISGVPESYVLSTERVAVEVVRALVGGLGIVAAVPITTALAAAVVRSGPVPGEGVDAGRRVEDGEGGGVAGADGELGDGAAVADRGAVAAADAGR
ncbi:YibE/F family protein [Kribbella sp. NPDC023855]|uniref:YibE/F family protein n=1 Tax=Kribbella sp. NPDC023855 TaxID=3154698 RepID=UPI00341011D5